MNKLNLFAAPDLTDDDKIQGFCYNYLQIQVLQLEAWTIAQQLLSLKLEEGKVLTYAQELAYLNGQFELLQTLINRSEESYKLLLQVTQMEQSGNRPSSFSS